MASKIKASEPLELLKFLAFDMCDLRDEEMEKIASSCPSLVELDVRNNPQVTGVGLKSVITRLSRTVQNIGLVNCEGVGRDAVDWARKQGIQVVGRYK